MVTLYSHHTTPSLRIGGNASPSTSFRGLIENVFVYSAALTSSELDYLRLSSPSPLGPVAGSSGYALELYGDRHVDIGGVEAVMR
jgi:hypothetical protein